MCRTLTRLDPDKHMLVVVCDQSSSCQESWRQDLNRSVCLDTSTQPESRFMPPLQLPPLLTWLPVRGAHFAVLLHILDGLEQAQRLIHRAADGHVVDGDLLDHPLQRGIACVNAESESRAAQFIGLAYVGSGGAI